MDKLTNQAATKFIEALQRDDNRCKIEENIVDPIVVYIGKRLWPYIVSLSLSLCILLLMLLYITLSLRRDIRLHDLKQ